MLEKRSWFLLSQSHPGSCACPLILAFLAAFVVSVPFVSANGQPADTGAQPADDGGQLADTGNFHIVWEVKNRFRLFRKEADFLHRSAASRGDGVLAEERRLEAANGGVGWAQDVVGNPVPRRLRQPVADLQPRRRRSRTIWIPRDHSVGVAISGTVPQGANLRVDVRRRQRTASASQRAVRCGGQAAGALRACHGCDGRHSAWRRHGAAGDDRNRTCATCSLPGSAISLRRARAIPTRRSSLKARFCFRRFGGGQYYRPGRAGFTGDRSCENGPASDAAAKDWAHHGARWMSPACHRSLYSYQIRTALALAIEQPHVAITFLPLACSGASIDAGMFNGQSFDDCPTDVGLDACAGTAPAQLTELKVLMARVHKQDPQRNLDMILLTVGANDVNFAALVGNVIVDARTERILLGRGGGIVGVRTRKTRCNETCRQNSRGCARRSSPTSAAIWRASFSYPTPTRPCRRRTSRVRAAATVVDIHPAFSADPTRLREAADFVDKMFLPAVKALATCDSKNACRDPMTDRMTFVDAHQSEFENHGMCVQAPNDPAFDRQCFSQDGKSFVDRPCRRRQRSAGLFAPSKRLPSLCVAGALDQNGRRQLFHGNDLSGRHPGDVAADRHSRRAVGRGQRGLWRRHPSDRRRLCGDGRRGDAGGASGAWPAATTGGQRRYLAAANV